MYARILAGFDGSEDGRKACRNALELAAALRSALTIASVVPAHIRPEELYLHTLVPRGGEAKALSHELEELSDEARRGGVGQVQTVVLHGRVVEAVLRYLHAHPHDLVVVGSRGLSAGRRVLLGSVSSELVDRAPCPVLVVRTPGRGGRTESGPPRPPGSLSE